MKYRTCPSCDEELPLDEDNFYRNANGKDGYDRQCKTCNKNYKDQFVLEKPKEKKRIFRPGFEKECDKDRLNRITQHSGSMFKEAF